MKTIEDICAQMEDCLARISEELHALRLSYRSKKENSEDQICNDEELAEIEAETKSSGIEDRAVENEANSNVISAIVKEESIPQFLMVTEADSTCVQHTNVILQQVSISPSEHSLNFCKANLDVKGNCQYAMGKTHQIWSDSNFGCVNDDACQVFDVIPMRTKVLPKEHKERFHKSWRFKFKHRVAPRDSKSVSDVPRTTLGPSSMLKMLLDAGGIVVTTDGNAILREIDVAHSAAKSMIELSRTQDERVGVGTTSIIVLAGELSQVGESFIAKSYHPTVIRR